MMAMRKFVLLGLALLGVLTVHAGDGDQYLSVNGGFLFNSTLSASVGYERELSYSDALELFGEVGDRWHRDPKRDGIYSDMFKKDYYWGGGILYKRNLKRYKNATLRLRFGPECGAHTGDYFFALEGGFELNYVFPSRVQFSVIQKNQVGFFHGDTFRNGLLIGIKIPF